MRVALDTNGTYTTQAGVARYIRGLGQGFKQLNRPDLQIIEFAWPVENFSYRQPQRAAKTIYRELIWAPFFAPSALARKHPDLLHSTFGVLVKPPRGIKHVATLHDLAVMRDPHRFRPWQRRSAMNCLRKLSMADRIICVSRFSAGEAASLLGLSMDRMEVVYNGCDFTSPVSSPAGQIPDFTLPPEFFLFVGSLEPGKNLSLLKEVYALAAHQGEVMPPLFIVGARWAGLPQEGPPPYQWQYLGRQPDEILKCLYSRALALLFPSRYEGFGLPIVEAMALGCPVVCSPVASLPEVGGQAVLYAEPHPMAYLAAMRQIARETNLRQDLIASGHLHAQKFTWKKCAEETLAVYRQVLQA